MKSFKSMTLRANKSAMKEADKGILRSGHKNLSFRFLLILALLVNMVFFNSCNKEDYNIAGNDDVIENTDNSSLEVRDFKNWFESQKVAKGLIGEQKPDWSKAELKMMRDGKTLHVSIEIYKGKNSLGNDSIKKLQIAKVKNGFTGSVQVFSFYNEEYAHAKYYNFNGQILEDGMYYAPKQLYMSLKRYTYTIKWSPVRLKSGNEPNDNPCAETDTIGAATPVVLGVPDSNAYNCHAYVWGDPSPDNPCYFEDYPRWSDCPDISGSGYSPVSTPQVGDRWVSYGNTDFYGKGTPIHSAIIMEVVNGNVTKLKAKDGDGPLVIYNPGCSTYQGYITDSIVYYRK